MRSYEIEFVCFLMSVSPRSISRIPLVDVILIFPAFSNFPGREEVCVCVCGSCEIEFVCILMSVSPPRLPCPRSLCEQEYLSLVPAIGVAVVFVAGVGVVLSRLLLW